MSCRTTPAGSAFTTYARIGAGDGDPISDVATLSAFHGLRAEYNRRRASYLTRNNREPDFMALTPDAWSYRGMQTPEEIYQDMIRRMRMKIEEDETLTDARRASLLARLDAAASADTPDQATLYALHSLQRKISTQRAAQQTFLIEASAELGISYEEAKNRYRELEDGIDRARNADDPETYTAENIQAAQEAGISSEAGAVHAFVTMREEVKAARRERFRDIPPLIAEHQPLTQSSGLVPDTNLEVVGYGYDPVSGYVEFQVKNLDTGEINIEGYRSSVRGESFETGMRGEMHSYSFRSHSNEPMTAGEFYKDYFKTRYYSGFQNDEEQMVASRAPRCARCGQWADTSHGCPSPQNQGPTYILSPQMLRQDEVRTSTQRVAYEYLRNDSTVTGEYSVDLPLVNDYRRLFREHGSLLIRNVNGQAEWGDRSNSNSWIRTTGDVYIYRTEEGLVKADTSSLRCNCIEYKENNYHCRHTRALGEAAIKRSIPPQRTPVAALTPEERAQRLAEKQARLEAAAASDWTRNEITLAEARKTWRDGSEVTYSENFDSFYEVYTKAIEDKEAKGSLMLPYKKENALDGLAKRGSGQAFGVEIEYDFPDTMSRQERDAANKRIGETLYEAGITGTPEKQRYHAAASKGYKDVHVDENGKGTWSWEHDGTVAGEIVTPPMYDEPETWEKLEKVVSVLRENGAVSSTKAGAHIHVGTGKYGKDPNKYAELARIVGQHEDVLYRLSADPARGEHRGLATKFNFVSPVRPVNPSGFSESYDVKRWQSSRSNIINLNGVKLDDNFKSSHAEFRMFDATLDVGVMQSQIKLAVSITEAANRITHKGGTLRGKESVGDHAERIKLRGRKKPKKEDFAEETATFRSLVDTLFQSKEDKDNMIRLFAANNWLKLPLGLRRRYGLVRNS